MTAAELDEYENAAFEEWWDKKGKVILNDTARTSDYYMAKTVWAAAKKPRGVEFFMGTGKGKPQ